jgi:hypothetical protein
MLRPLFGQGYTLFALSTQAQPRPNSSFRAVAKNLPPLPSKNLISEPNRSKKFA